MRSAGKFVWNKVFETSFLPDFSQICLSMAFLSPTVRKMNCLIAGSCDFH